MQKHLPFILSIALLIFLPAMASAQSDANAPPSAARKVHVPILTYHSVRPYYPGITNLVKEYTVPPDIFDDQLRYLRDNGYTAITNEELDQYLISGKPLPAKPVLITFDDGWENQYTYAFPILKKYHDPAVFYIYSRAVGVKHFLTWDQVRELQTAGMEIAGHSRTHPELPTIKDIAEMRKELADSKVVIEKELGRPITDFAYPYGEYSDLAIQVLKDSGYRSARALLRSSDPNSNALYTLPGYIITGDFNRFVALVNR